jgi:SAM-dependent methyltransferase
MSGEDLDVAEPVTFTKQLVDARRSPTKPLMTNAFIAAEALRLRAMLEADQAPEIQAEAKSFEADFRRINWWQRIRVPGSKASTTSFPNFLEGICDPGWLNTMNGALSYSEGYLCRPLPKWAYIKNAMPDLRGKSVLEIGCNNGFFSFAFADELHAESVLGVDVVPSFLDGAKWLLARRNDKTIAFRQADIMLDLTIPRHDVVFMSEVHGHFVDPMFGILRALNLAKETLILDGAAGNGAGLEIPWRRCRPTNRSSHLSRMAAE